MPLPEMGANEPPAFVVHSMFTSEGRVWLFSCSVGISATGRRVGAGSCIVVAFATTLLELSTVAVLLVRAGELVAVGSVVAPMIELVATRSNGGGVTTTVVLLGK
jgi:hypothetical protein